MICRDEAIVLRTHDLRETSKIAVFYSKKFGKLTGVLKGIRADHKKFASRLDFLSVNEIIFYKKRFSDIHLVSQCDLKKDFNYLKLDVLKFGIASFCAELVYSVMAQEDAHPEIYELMLDLLDSLEKTELSHKLIYNFSLKILSLSGFQPHLESCVICRDSIESHAYFSNRFGGLLCHKCSHRDAKCENILAGTISTILFLQKTKWPQSLRLNILPSVENQLSDILFSFLSFHLDKKFKSLKLLNELLDRKIKMC